jgi:hypothetical protein
VNETSEIKKLKHFLLFQLMHTIIKIIEMLKQFKIITLAPTCFGSRRNHHQGAVLCLAKTTKYGFSVLVGIDAVNVMVAYAAITLIASIPTTDATDARCKREDCTKQYTWA